MAVFPAASATVSGAPSAAVEPIAVTGFGLVSPAGAGADALWRALEARESRLGPLEQIDSRGLSMRHGGEVPDAVLDSGQAAGETEDRAARMASLAMSEALERSGILDGGGPAGGIGLALGTALGAVQTLEKLAGGDAAASRWGDVPLQVLTERLARRFELDGPQWTFSVTCVSGLYALEQAMADLRLGRAGAVLCGALDTLSLFMQSGFCSLKALSPSGRLRPFDREHDGIVLGEAAAFVLLEGLSRARERGAPVYATVAANRLVSDATHLTSPDATGEGMARAISLALEDAGLTAAGLGCVTPTATGSPVYDRMQSRAVLAALGPAGERIPVTTWEPLVGHALASTGILGLVHAALALERGTVLPVGGTRSLDEECHLRYILGEAVPLRARGILALTVGFGGQNGATVLTGEESDPRRAPRG